MKRATAADDMNDLTERVRQFERMSFERTHVMTKNAVIPEILQYGGKALQYGAKALPIAARYGRSALQYGKGLIGKLPGMGVKPPVFNPGAVPFGPSVPSGAAAASGLMSWVPGWAKTVGATVAGGVGMGVGYDLYSKWKNRQSAQPGYVPPDMSQAEYQEAINQMKRLENKPMPASPYTEERRRQIMNSPTSYELGY